MAATTTNLSVILSRMDRWQAVSTVEEQYKVRDIDEAIRNFRRNIQAPWNLQKGSLRVFDDVLEYPTASDHDEMAFFDNKEKTWSSKPHFRYTSIQEFYEDPNNRNDAAEIWDGNTRYLGLRYKPTGVSSQLINNAETAANFSVAGDATSVTRDTVFFKEGSASMRIAITLSASTATVSNSSTSFSDSNYRRKYYFRWVYFDAVPTTVTIRFGNDASNYLSKAVTTQFSGQALKADSWNLLAMDLNEATTTGTITTSAFDYEAIVMTGAATGTYYIDSSYLREWSLLDYWYYSKYSVALVGTTTAGQEYFYNSSEVYSTDSMLIGDSEWVDIIMYDALVTTVGDKENSSVLKEIKAKRADAWEKFYQLYPSMRPTITTSRYNFQTDYMSEYNSSLRD